ncbi:MAG: hypothetical protein A4E28_00868 [Methanocella sp. PtaU1.Bin125]|nr:MAG: hypothetical protein A4E28_00868 [Methanocella sp. PtaU1.Bin125]
MTAVFAVDVGSGTQDVLIADEQLRRPDFKIVMPAPTQLFAAKIRRLRRDLFCDGYTMGGGAISGALRRHAEKYHVVMTPAAARTVRDNLDEVRERGIEIGKERDLPPGYAKLTLIDVDMGAFDAALAMLNYSLPKDIAVAVAVQDHGVAPKGVSDRQFRFRQIEKKIKNGATFRDFIITERTKTFSRASAVIQSLNDQGYEDVLVMDTKIAGIYGGLYGVKLPAIAVDAGNGHTTAASVAEDGTIVGVFEHHTMQLTPGTMRGYIEKLADGTITNEEVFDDGGHGAHVREAITPRAIVATGPRRQLAIKTGLDVRLASPLDDVYMVGPVGMIRAYRALKEVK